MPWVLGTWVNSHASRLSGRRRHEAGRFRLIVRDILARRPSPVVVVLASGDDTLHAWACATPQEALHYAYTPREIAGRGLARRVIAAAFGSYPDVIPVTYRWPYASARFVFEAARPTRQARQVA